MSKRTPPPDSWSPEDEPRHSRSDANHWLRFLSALDQDDAGTGAPEAIARGLLACYADKAFREKQPRTWARIGLKLADLFAKQHESSLKHGDGAGGHVVELVCEFGPPKEEELNGPPTTRQTKSEELEELDPDDPEGDPSS